MLNMKSYLELSGVERYDKGFSHKFQTTRVPEEEHRKHQAAFVSN